MRPPKVDIYGLPKFVATVMKITGQTWDDVVNRTPLRSLVMMLEFWNSDAEEQVINEEHLDRLMSRKAQDVSINLDDATAKFVLSGGYRLKDG